MTRRISLPVMAALPPHMLKEVHEYDLHVAANRYAESRGWKCFYIRKTAAMGKDGEWKGLAHGGWPDSVYVRGDRMLCVEFKAERGTVTPEQREWLAALAGVPGVATAMYRPRDAAELMRWLE